MHFEVQIQERRPIPIVFEIGNLRMRILFILQFWNWYSNLLLAFVSKCEADLPRAEHSPSQLEKEIELVEKGQEIKLIILYFLL